MVDVGSKPVTTRSATAEGRVRVNETAFSAIRDNAMAKGDVLTVAKIAGIQAAKQTGLLIPLCHALPLDSVDVHTVLDESTCSVHVVATARCCGRTGVEMEALTAVSIACLTVYDMCKAVDRHIAIGDIRLVSKTGGRSGHEPSSPSKEGRLGNTGDRSGL